MNRVVASMLAGLAVASAGLALAAPAGAASEISDIGNASLQSVASCINSSHQLAAAIVVDNSGSLKNTDPQKQRFAAIETVLDALESLATQKDGSVEVQATLATFGATYDTVVGWGDVTGSHGDDLRNAVTNTLPKLESDPITDYRAALKGAQSSLNAHASADECKLMLWFTDGKLDVDNSGGTGQANKDARVQLCTEQGIVDGVRGDDIVITSLALFTDSGAGSTDPADRALLQAISEGTNGKTKCGKDPIPQGWTNGAYLRADDASALNQVFAQVGALIGGGQEAQGYGCPGVHCQNGNLTVAIDQGIPHVRIVTDADLAGGGIAITPPGGSPSPLPLDPPEFGGGTVSAIPGNGLTTIDIAVPRSGGGHGDWIVSLGDGAATATVYYYWDARLELASPDHFVMGEAAQVGATLVDSKTGVEIDPTLYKGLVLAAGAQGATVVPAQDGRTISVTPSADAAANSLTVGATVKAVTQPTVIELGPVNASTGSVPVKPPASYPTIDSESLSFPEIVGTAESTATLKLTGSAEGETTACFIPGDLAGPAAAGDIALSPTGLNDNCVTLAANEKKNVSFTLATANAADGRVDGTVDVAMTGVNADEELTMSVPVTASMSVPVDKRAEALWVAAFILLAVVIAWLTALIGRHFADRFRFGPGAQYARVPIEIAGGGIRRVDGKSGQLLDAAEDFHRVSSIGNSKTTASADVAGLAYRRKAPFNPWGAAKGVVSTPGQIVASGSYAEMINADGSLAPARFPGTTGFLLVADSGDVHEDRAKADLVVVVDAPDGVSAVLPDRLDALHTTPWSEVLAALNAAAVVRTERAASDTPVERGLAKGVQTRGSSGGTPATPATQDFTGAADADATQASSLPPANDWLMGGDPAPLPPASGGGSGEKPGRRAKPDRPSRKAKPTPTQDSPGGGNSPPPPDDFLS